MPKFSEFGQGINVTVVNQLTQYSRASPGKVEKGKVEKPEKVLMDWLHKKPERTATPCIAYLYRKGVRRKRCLERVPLPRRANKEAIASEIARRMIQMKTSGPCPSAVSQEFLAVAVYINGTIACWAGEKWVKTRNFTGNKNAVKGHLGRQALLMLMAAI